MSMGLVRARRRLELTCRQGQARLVVTGGRWSSETQRKLKRRRHATRHLCEPAPGWHGCSGGARFWRAVILVLGFTNFGQNEVWPSCFTTFGQTIFGGQNQVRPTPHFGFLRSGGGPVRVGGARRASKGEGPEGWVPERWVPKSSHPSVEIWWCLKRRGLKCARLEFQGCRVKPWRPQSLRVFTRHPESPNVAGEGKKKSEILGPPPFGAPPFGAPPFGPHPRATTKKKSKLNNCNRNYNFKHHKKLQEEIIVITQIKINKITSTNLKNTTSIGQSRKN